MTNQKLTVNISVNSEIDAKKILEKLYAEIAKEIEVKVEVAKEEDSLKVGDYAKVVGDFDPEGKGQTHGLAVGTIVQITEINTSEFLKEFPYSAGDLSFAKRDLEPATDAEISKFKAKQAEAKRWEAIGRKPNEFKKGDAVQYKNAFTTVTESKPGLIRINQSNNVDKNIAVRPADLTLVFPVESRFE